MEGRCYPIFYLLLKHLTTYNAEAIHLILRKSSIIVTNTNPNHAQDMQIRSCDRPHDLRGVKIAV